MKMLKMAQNGIKVKVVTSNSGAGETNRVHESVQQFLKSNNNLEYKIVDTKEIFIHAKVYVKDGMYAVVGSANFTTESFWHNAESIVIFDSKEDIQRVEREFHRLWDTYHSYNFVIEEKGNLKRLLGKVKSR